MSFFLSIGFLTALPLVAAPLLLHLFDRRRNVVIDWGAMQFLVNAATQRTNARRMQQWLLLLLRMLALAALIFALARPLFPGSWWGHSQRSEVIVILDNSLSAQRTVDDATLLDRFVRLANEQQQKFPPGDLVRYLVTSPYPTWVTPVGIRIPANTSAEVANKVPQIQATHGSGDLLAALRKAIQSPLEDATTAKRSIIVYADRQRSDWQVDDVNRWQQLKSALAATAIPTEIELVEFDTIGDLDSGNISIVELRSNRNTVGLEQSFTVTAGVKNHGSQDVGPLEVTWRVADDIIGHSPVQTLSPGAVQEVSFAHSFDSPGVFAVQARVSGKDVLPSDNTAAVIVQAAQRVPVLLVESSEGFAELQQDAYLIRAALGQLEGEQFGGWTSVFEPRTVTPWQLETTDLQDYFAVVVPNYSVLSDAAIENLEDYVAAGGGLWLALGPRAEISDFNEMLYRRGDGLSPVGIDRIVDESRRSEKTHINPFLKPHPATRDLADQARLDLGDVDVERRFRFSFPDSMHDVPSLLTLTNGESLVVENRFGHGRVLVQAVPLTYQWSGLTVSQSFVVMVENWLNYVSESAATDFNLRPGEPVVWKSSDPDLNSATLVLPNGEEVSLIGEVTDAGATFRSSRTTWPGDYRLETGIAGEAIPFRVARSPEESDLTSLTDQERETIALSLAPATTADSTALDAVAGASPFWPALLICLILAMSAELVLSGWIARQRFGLSGVADSSASGFQIEDSTSAWGRTTGVRASQELPAAEVSVK